MQKKSLIIFAVILAAIGLLALFGFPGMAREAMGEQLPAYNGGKLVGFIAAALIFFAGWLAMRWRRHLWQLPPEKRKISPYFTTYLSIAISAVIFILKDYKALGIAFNFWQEMFAVVSVCVFTSFLIILLAYVRHPLFQPRQPDMKGSEDPAPLWNPPDI